MAPNAPREAGVWRQTKALLFKNCLVKCRTKKSSVQVSRAALLHIGVGGSAPFYSHNSEASGSALNSGLKKAVLEGMSQSFGWKFILRTYGIIQEIFLN